MGKQRVNQGDDKMNPADDYIKDKDELIFTGKRVREYRDICRNEGYKQALDDIQNLPIPFGEFIGDYIDSIEKLKEEFYTKILGDQE